MLVSSEPRPPTRVSPWEGKTLETVAEHLEKVLNLDALRHREDIRQNSWREHIPPNSTEINFLIPCWSNKAYLTANWAQAYQLAILKQANQPIYLTSFIPFLPVPTCFPSFPRLFPPLPPPVSPLPSPSSFPLPQQRTPPGHPPLTPGFPFRANQPSY